MSLVLGVAEKQQTVDLDKVLDLSLFRLQWLAMGYEDRRNIEQFQHLSEADKERSEEMGMSPAAKSESPTPVRVGRTLITRLRPKRR